MEIEALPEKYYALGIFASGFESRSTHVADAFGCLPFEHIVVLEFDDNSNALSRKNNDGYFSAIQGIERFRMKGLNDDQTIYSILDHCAQQLTTHTLRILIDYSVMTRSWYAAVLTWARLAEINVAVEVDFVYAGGMYMSDFDPLLISEIESLPNFEGISGGFRKTTALFGLGYDKYATLAVHDRIEPDVLYCCVASQGPEDESAKRVKQENQSMVDAAEQVIELPLFDVSAAFRLLCDLVISIDRDSHIVVVPMGPKPHVLATLLASIRLPWLTCLHAKGNRAQPIQVEASGKICIARVYFSPLSPAFNL